MFSLFPITGREYVLRQPKKLFHSDCLQTTVKNGGGSVMTWDAISWKSAEPLIYFMKELTKVKIQILSDQVHPMPQGGNVIFQDENALIHTARVVKE